MADSPSSKAAEQARIRKERREAKIRAGGSARLDKITGLGGGIPRDPPQQQPSADPEEVDISQHYYEPSRPARVPSNAPTDAQLRQMMLGFDPSTPPAQNPFNLPNSAGTGADDEDPMMKMFSQMLNSSGGAIPPFPTQTPGETTVADSNTYIWRIIHAVFALGLGLYIAFTTSFAGTRHERSSPPSPSFFWAFATAELVLQGGRLFVEKGRVQQTGILGTVLGFLPEPYRGYVALAMRYSRIWTTVSGDAMVLVFVLGVCAWWRGG